MIHAHIIVSGRVHGVSFRYAAQAKAIHMGITGSVKNLKAGQVEIEAEGDSINIERFVDWCKHGPLFARVEDVAVTYGQVRGFESFEILR